MNLHIINELKKQFYNKKVFNNSSSVIILITYSYIWLSIGKYVEINFNKPLSNGLIYVIIFFVSSLLLLIKFIKNKKLPTISILMIYPIASSIGYINNIKVNQNYDLLIHFFFTISALFVFFAVLESNKNKIKLFKYFFRISLIFIFLVFFIMVLPDLVSRIFNNIHVREINFVTLKLFFFNYTYIQNSNGAARIAVLIFIIFFTNFIFKIKKNKKYQNDLIFCTLLSIIIFYYQSRLSIIFISIYVFLWIMSFSNKKILDKFFFYILIIIIPFLIQNFYNLKLSNNIFSDSKNQLEKNNKTYSDLKNLQKILKQNRILGFDFNVVQSEFHASDAHEKCDLVSNNKFTRIIDIYSSGRICGWVILFKDLKKKNIIFGKGFFHDKIYLKEYQKIASNSYINILYNSGICY